MGALLSERWAATPLARAAEGDVKDLGDRRRGSGVLCDVSDQQLR